MLACQLHNAPMMAPTTTKIVSHQCDGFALSSAFGVLAGALVVSAMLMRPSAVCGRDCVVGVGLFARREIVPGVQHQPQIAVVIGDRFTVDHALDGAGCMVRGHSELVACVTGLSFDAGKVLRNLTL